MATSAFKSTTKRASVGGSSSEDSSRSLRRSRSVSRFSPRSIDPEPTEEYRNPTPPPPQFPEISLDDLALEFFSRNENEDNKGRVERKEREGRSVSRPGQIGRWASDTASSQRRGRSVSRPRGEVVSTSGSAPGAKNVSSYDTGGSRRRRSLSVAARSQLSDSENEADHFRNSSGCANLKAPVSGKGQMPKETALSNRRLGRTQSHKDLHLLPDDYSSLGRQQTALTRGHRLQSDNSEDFSKIRKSYSEKLEQLERRKHDLLTEMLIEEQREREVSIMVKELPSSRTSALTEKSSHARKKSRDKHRASKRLTEEAEKYLEDFISNVEDTDISSFDGERSDGSSILGATIKVGETYKSPTGPISYNYGEMDGVSLPWLQLETGQCGSLSSIIKAHTLVTPKTLQWDSEKGMVSLNNRSDRSTSSCGSWSPCHSSGREETCQVRQLGDERKSRYDFGEQLKLRKNEEVLFEIYRERNRISSGCLLLCTGVLY
ncbi:hypothetical protein ABFS82_09G063000 [Erythranthe guttata]|uniref:uncharacterized protein LOC105974142 n=1 Tax=Erythranthe guttata TaxID=4155 RepID=UPI00064D95C9|nr:PREDICTED: uncharacterized protein LOC105974142 [Erythranthe guttata]|eukprot:XP_012854667.1 PREDICTED: uncharacterized protein LOC105974142 [Erythranthe guttata]